MSQRQSWNKVQPKSESNYQKSIVVIPVSLGIRADHRTESWNGDGKH